MSKVEIYTTMRCPYCTAAKRLLQGKAVAYIEHDVTVNLSARAQMTARAGGRTSVPQIFVGDTHVGGFDDLNTLERAGGLDKMLTPA
ncbi:hypothetical protein MNBD_ALPHA09-1306 [hydrothermal vent metagenome]|uniref:Glutaredoxin domain-containing protein n=1 Tax=hydrothermal vent metagenome TaxID=652676 RepID=A0A3B0TPZ3_9ZZZZ